MLLIKYTGNNNSHQLFKDDNLLFEGTFTECFDIMDQEKRNDCNQRIIEYVNCLDVSDTLKAKLLKLSVTAINSYR